MFERSCLRQRRLFTFFRHYASGKVSCGMFTKVCRARINYLKFSCFLCFIHDYPLILCEAIFSQNVAKEGVIPSGIRYVPLTRSEDYKWLPNLTE